MDIDIEKYWGGAAAALQSLKDQWQNLPPSWENSTDPCGAPWAGVTCINSRVTRLSLSAMNLKGTLGGDIAELSELKSLDLSFNPGLTGPLPSEIGNLTNLDILILAGCSFSGSIPEEIGNLANLSFLALNSNNFSGNIPPTLGSLSNLYWLDVADNQLTGSLPVSTNTAPGLDLLLNAKHFHFNKNQLSGSIPFKLFSSEMVLIHVILNDNRLTGEIPATLGVVKTLEILRLDRNALTGTVPSNLNNLTSLNELQLANNLLTGPVPDLTGINFLNYVLLKNNTFNGTLGGNTGQQLQLVDFENNQISGLQLSFSYKIILILKGNPLCVGHLSNASFCQLQQEQKPYSTSLAKCGSKSCASNQKLNPQTCDCAYPYEGKMYFWGPSFRDLSNATFFKELEMSLWVELVLTPGYVSLQNILFNSDGYLQVQLDLFPANGKYFNKTEVQKIGLALTNKTFIAPHEFGPYYFIASPYAFPGYP
ncbi:hypothetical protein IFM89_013527 [Coptis chinensis]|uniref:Leucine-rich repeat-containing N-terminal plant-type domain-containing protein n=1 Tax=Coptis chinensis TaxID=261450 RepID=A0A835LM35_9MAGN|nr:hypothetical protein IFM89_013527 [Coptis chinensis]